MTAYICIGNSQIVTRRYKVFFLLRREEGESVSCLELKRSYSFSDGNHCSHIKTPFFKILSVK